MAMNARDLIDAYNNAIIHNASAKQRCEAAHCDVENSWNNMRMAIKQLRDDIIENGPIVDADAELLYTAHDEVVGVEHKPIRVV